MGGTIKTHRDLDVYQMGFEAAMRIFELTKRFPKEETYSLTDQIRRSSRSVCSNIAEAWRKRRYEAAFVSKLNDGGLCEQVERCGNRGGRDPDLAGILGEVQVSRCSGWS